jgi:hypothetical protein
MRLGPDSPEARRFRLALELFEAAEDLKRQSLRREFPEAAESEIESRINAWLRSRPGAPHGDAVGRRVSLEELDL